MTKDEMVKELRDFYKDYHLFGEMEEDIQKEVFRILDLGDEGLISELYSEINT